MPDVLEAPPTVIAANPGRREGIGRDFERCPAKPQQLELVEGGSHSPVIVITSRCAEVGMFAPSAAAKCWRLCWRSRPCRAKFGTPSYLRSRLSDF